MSTQIALIILGNPVSGAGLQTLATLGRFPSDEFAKMDSTPLIKEGLTYRIRHAGSYITYTLKNVSVRPSDAMRDGSLIISIAISKLQKLKDDSSPYTLLKEIYNKFVADYLTNSEDVLVYNKNVEVNKSDFEEILKKYEVEDRADQVYVTMQDTGGVGIVCASSEEQLSELFRDSQYPEFRIFSHIEVGRTCQSTVQIDIPRKKEYQVILNLVKRRTLTRSTDIFDSSEYLQDSEYKTYKGSHVRFTLEELLEAPDCTLFDGRVVLNGYRIICKVEQKDKMFEFSPVILDDESGTGLKEDDKKKVITLLKNGVVKIRFNGCDVTRCFTDGTKLPVVGEGVNGRLMVSPERYDNFTFKANANNRDYQLYLNVKVKQNLQPRPKLPTIPSVVDPQLPITTGNNSFVLIVSGNPNVYKYKYYIILSSPNDKDFEAAQRIRFNANGIATISFDSEWQVEKDIKYSFRRKNGKRVEETDSQKLNSRNNPVELLLPKEEDFMAATPLWSWKKWLCFVVIAALSSFIVGIYLGQDLSLQNNKKEVSPEVVVNYVESEGGNEETDTLDKIVVVPTEPAGDVSQEEPELPETQITNIPVVEEKRQTKPSPNYRKQILDAVNKSDWNTVGELLAPAVKAGDITVRQRNAIEALYWGTERKPYSKAQMEKVKRQLKDKKFKTIDEIADFKLIVN